MSTYSLIVGGYRDNFSVLSFDPSSAKLKVVEDSPAPYKASWLEHSNAKAGPLASSRTLYAVSEKEPSGDVVSLKLSNDKVEVTSKRETHGAPAHVHVMKDGSGVVVSNFGGGSIIYFPLNEDGTVSDSSKSAKLDLPFVYEGQEAPNPERQEAAHAHQVLEGEKGQLYVADLGSDRVWVVERSGESDLVIKGWLQCPPGSGPRHGVFSEDGQHLYVLTEMTSEILVFSLSNPTYPIIPIPDFRVNVIPPTAPKEGRKYMKASELAKSPLNPTTLYATNRNEPLIEETSKGAVSPPDAQSADAIAIALLSEAGDKLESVKFVRTGLVNIRGMRVSPDGKYVAAAGRSKGGLEIWAVSGSRADAWKLAAKNEAVENVTDLLWL